MHKHKFFCASQTIQKKYRFIPRDNLFQVSFTLHLVPVLRCVPVLVAVAPPSSAGWEERCDLREMTSVLERGVRIAWEVSRLAAVFSALFNVSSSANVERKSIFFHSFNRLAWKACINLTKIPILAASACGGLTIQLPAKAQPRCKLLYEWAAECWLSKYIYCDRCHTLL